MAEETNAEYQIRNLGIDDLAPVFHLGERLYTLQKNPNLYRIWDETQVTDYFTSDPEGCFVAELEGEIVGFLLSYVVDKYKSSRFYGYLEWLGVHPGHQGQGLASRLFDAFLAYMQERNVPMLLVDVEARNDKALEFFTGKGFSRPTSQIYLTMNLERKRGR